MYGFPPLKYDDSKIDKKIYKKTKQSQRAYVDKSYINVRQILYNKKKEINWHLVKNDDVDVVNTI